jgi:hypothetical protein
MVHPRPGPETVARSGARRPRRPTSGSPRPRGNDVTQGHMVAVLHGVQAGLVPARELFGQSRLSSPGAWRRSSSATPRDGPNPAEFPVSSPLSRERRVRTRLPAPPPSLRLRRLCGRTPRPTQKVPRFRGVLGEGRSRIGTGDGEFRADRGRLVAFISVAKFGGPDSLPIRAAAPFRGPHSSAGDGFHEQLAGRHARRAVLRSPCPSPLGRGAPLILEHDFPVVLRERPSKWNRRDRRSRTRTRN